MVFHRKQKKVSEVNVAIDNTVKNIYIYTFKFSKYNYMVVVRQRLNKNKNKFISEQKKKRFNNFYKYLNNSWEPILWVLPLSHRLPKHNIVQKY